MRSGVTKMPINVNQDSPLLGSGGGMLSNLCDMTCWARFTLT